MRPRMPDLKPGDLARIIQAKDQPREFRKFVGEYCIVVKNLGPEDGVSSSHNIWLISLSSGKTINVHALDLEEVAGDA